MDQGCALPDSVERGLAASASGALPIDRFTMGLNGIETDRKIAELDDARCGVCDEIAVQATRAACKHIFCEACIYSLLDISLPITAPLPSVSVGCPRGCGPVDASQLQVAVELRARLQRTTVCCTNTNLGCSYQGPLSECVEHEAQQCAWRRVRCPKCAKKFIARDVEFHDLTECPLRNIVCVHCGPTVAIRARDASAHAQQCPNQPLECPESCGITGLNRSALFSHLTFDCPMHLRPCPFAAAGCTFRAKRDEIEAHTNNDAATHMPLLLQSLISLQKSRDEQQAELVSLRARVEELEKMNDGSGFTMNGDSALDNSFSSSSKLRTVSLNTQSRTPAEVILARTTSLMSHRPALPTSISIATASAALADKIAAIALSAGGVVQSGDELDALQSSLNTPPRQLSNSILLSPPASASKASPVGVELNSSISKSPADTDANVNLRPKRLPSQTTKMLFMYRKPQMNMSSVPEFQDHE